MIRLCIRSVELSTIATHNLGHLVVKSMLREWMPNWRPLVWLHGVKSPRINEPLKTACRLSAVKGEIQGSRPNQRTRAMSQIALSVSEFLSPMNAIPRMSIWRFRKASIESRE